jgi:cell wall-associated NlpC family hydrolase
VPNGRTWRPISAGVALSLAVLTGVTALPGPGYADHKPSISQVQRRLDSLDHRAEQTSERLNTIRVLLQRRRATLSAVRVEFQQERTRVRTLRHQLATVAVDEFQGGELGTTVSLLTSKTPGRFLAQLTTVQAVNADQAAALKGYVRARGALAARAGDLRAQTDAIAKDKAHMARQKALLDHRAAHARTLLDQLRQERRARLAAQRRAAQQAAQRAQQQRLARAAAASTAPPSAPAPAPPAPAPAPAPPPSSGRGATAVAFALAQVGDPYVYGGAGPNVWDCSGLTMGAWAAAGVSLPHSASLQYSSGTPVSLSALQPGDLVFYYSPISHVALYIGNGQVVHAPHPGSTVQVVPLYSMPVAGAVRPG